MKKKVAIFWFRRDLRLNDNCGLFNALQSGFKILPIFIFDEAIINELPKDDARITFIYKSLEKINSKLQKIDNSLLVIKGKPIAVFEELLATFNVQKVFINHDYETYALQRDAGIKAFLEAKNISFKSYKDQVIFERNEIVKNDGTPYKIFTPFSKIWLKKLHEKSLTFYPSEQFHEYFYQTSENKFPTLIELGFKASKIEIPNYNVASELVKNYKKNRDFPAKNGTSKIGVHLRFGTVSIREIVALANQDENKTFLKELIWREFFMQILWHFPKITTDNFKSKYNSIVWRNNEKEFEKWKSGNTGYPLVDAGMRELNATGFMHNRIRMLVGSFLCKHLLIDWRWGEAYFSEKLLDYEMSSNIGNWQWVAGCGADAAPYFRIFNPTTQILKFDKNLEYIKKWVPEFQELTYAKPMVDHKFARERCLKTYKAIF